MIIKPEFPLVSIGMPVYNGGKHLRQALESLLAQSYTNLEIIVSDNASTDTTSTIVQEYMGRDQRIHYYRQISNLGPEANFNFTLKQASGEYFMWAAHDDSRSTDYVSKLVQALNDDPQAILSFGDLCLTHEPESIDQQVKHKFSTSGQAVVSRLWSVSQTCCYHIYGLWRINELRKVALPGMESTLAADLIVLIAASFLGDFRYVPGPRFIYLVAQKSLLNGFNYKYLYYFAKFIIVTYRTSRHVTGRGMALLAAFFAFIGYMRVLPGFIVRRFKRLRRAF